MRRPTTVELMLLTTVFLWALNLSITKYLLDEGVAPLSYSFVRYGLAGAIFVALTLLVERTLRIDRRRLPVLAFTIVVLCLNQLCFVFALDRTTAATIGLILGSIPIFAALLGVALGRERLSRRFWLGAGVSFLGVGLVAVGSGGELSASYVGILLGLATCATWAAYSVVAAPLMAASSPSRVSAIVMPGVWLLLAIVGAPQTSEQDWGLGWELWALLVLATVGPLVLTNILWFRSIARIGPARATLAANLQPFVAAVLAVVLLSEPLGAVQVVGGLLIASGILAARRRSPAPQAT
jgi:drug/metabolite transporter (DMT)-like permease